MSRADSTKTTLGTGSVRHAPFHERQLSREQVDAQLRKLNDASARHRVNYRWESLDAARYPRYARGLAFPVSFPNSKQLIVMVDPVNVFVTNALKSAHHPYCHCAHYFLKGVCDLGADCNFIHMAFIKDVDCTAFQVLPPSPAPRMPTSSGGRTFINIPGHLTTADAATRRMWFRNPYAGMLEFMHPIKDQCDSPS